MRITALAIFLFSALAAFGQNPATPKFPGSVVTDTDIGVACNNAKSTLASAITSTALTIPLKSTASFCAPSYVTLGPIPGEVVKVCSISGNDLVVCPDGRGIHAYNSSHQKDEPAVISVESDLINQSIAEIKAMEQFLGIGGANVVPSSRTVNGQALTGNVVLNTSHIAESGNLYFTNSRALSAIANTGHGGMDFDVDNSFKLTMGRGGVIRSFYDDAMLLHPGTEGISGSFAALSTAVNPLSGGPDKSQLVLALLGKTDSVSKYFNGIVRFGGYNTSAAMPWHDTYEIGTEGNLLDNNTFSVYRFYLWDFVNNRGIFHIDNSAPDLFVFDSNINVYVSGNATVAGGVNAGYVYTPAGSVTSGYYRTGTNCASTASPAVCGGAASGAIVVPAGATTVVVNTYAVTADSEIIATFDSSLGTRLGVTCNTTAVQPTVSARTAAVSFTLKVPAAPTTNPACFSYMVIN